MAVCRWLWYWERNIQHSDWLIAKVFISDRPQPTINSLQPANFARISTQSNLYLAMNCSVFDVHTYKNSTYHLVQFGPNSQAILNISAFVQEISNDNIPKSWWREYLSWRYFQALLRTGTVLSIHNRTVQNFSRYWCRHWFD